MIRAISKEKIKIWIVLLPFSLFLGMVPWGYLFSVGINEFYEKKINDRRVYWEEIKSLDLNSEPPFIEFNPYRFRLGNTYPDFYFAVTKTSTQNKEALVQSLEKNEWAELQDGILVKKIKDKVIYVNIQEKNEKVEVFMTPKL